MGLSLIATAQPGQGPPKTEKFEVTDRYPHYFIEEIVLEDSVETPYGTYSAYDLGRLLHLYLVDSLGGQVPDLAAVLAQGQSLPNGFNITSNQGMTFNSGYQIYLVGGWAGINLASITGGDISILGLAGTEFKVQVPAEINQSLKIPMLAHATDTMVNLTLPGGIQISKKLSSIGGGAGGGGTDDQVADEVPFTPAVGLSSTNVQDAIEETINEMLNYVNNALVNYYTQTSIDNMFAATDLQAVTDRDNSLTTGINDDGDTTLISGMNLFADNTTSFNLWLGTDAGKGSAFGSGYGYGVNLGFGLNAGRNFFGSSTTLLGHSAGRNTKTYQGSYSVNPVIDSNGIITAVGLYAGSDINSANLSSFFGNYAGHNNNHVFRSIGFGEAAMSNVPWITPNDSIGGTKRNYARSIAIGSNTMAIARGDHTNNTAIGFESMLYSKGKGNVAIGPYTLFRNFNLGGGRFENVIQIGDYTSSLGGGNPFNAQFPQYAKNSIMIGSRLQWVGENTIVFPSGYQIHGATLGIDRLLAGAGQDGQVIKLVAGVPTWAADNGGAGGSYTAGTGINISGGVISIRNNGITTSLLNNASVTTSKMAAISSMNFIANFNSITTSPTAVPLSAVKTALNFTASDIGLGNANNRLDSLEKVRFQVLTTRNAVAGDFKSKGKTLYTLGTSATLTVPAGLTGLSFGDHLYIKDAGSGTPTADFSAVTLLDADGNAISSPNSVSCSQALVEYITTDTFQITGKYTP